MNREEWLSRATKHLSRWIDKETDLTVPADVVVGVGFPGGRSFNTVVGQCWKSTVSDGINQLWVSPVLVEPVDVLATLLHELIHAADDCSSGHQKAFRKAWKELGFIDKPTCSVPGPELTERLKGIAERVGEYPHTKIDPKKSTIKKQTTRMLKVECPSCGCTVRMARKWLDEVGAPDCGCGAGQMKEAW